MFFLKFIPPKVLSMQARKPTGVIGRYVMTKIFNEGNADLNAFVMDMLELKSCDSVLEIGFGPGKLINQMAAVTTDGVVEGVDFSNVMFKQASKVNQRHIVDGKVRLHNLDCRMLPFENDTFNKICSTNTLYFWRAPEDNFCEMHRVMRPGGTIAIGFRDAKQMNHLNLSKDIFTTYTTKQVENLLSNVGFHQVRVLEKKGNPFLSYCALATKTT